MQFVARKLQALRYQHKTLNDVHPGYTGPSGIAIAESKSVRHLVIVMSNGASFQVHIAK